MNGALLAVHTSDAVGSVAVAAGEALVGHEFVSAGQAAPVVLQEIQRALVAAGVTLAGCAGVAVTLGPGSFTGIRIGLATVQGLAAARGWPVFTVDSLLAFAAACPPAAAVRGVVFDARRGEVYAALYHQDGVAAGPRCVLAAFCAPVAAAAERLAQAAAGADLVLAGSGAALVQACAPLARARVDAPVMPVAVALARLARAGACRRTEPRGLEPVYLRKSDAELQRQSAGERPA